MAAQIAQGLYRAHTHSPSIVHRDVKPENVFLHRAERSLESVVKVMDFGVAAVVGERARQRIGTPRYMAPEQVSGDPVSPQTDQYALALVVYEMLTSRFPWDVNLRDVSALADAHRGLPPAPPSRFCPWLPERIEAALLKALAKEPAARHDTVHGLLFELRGLQSIDSQSSCPTGDAHSTEPMVGTLAEGGAALRVPVRIILVRHGRPVRHGDTREPVLEIPPVRCFARVAREVRAPEHLAGRVVGAALARPVGQGPPDLRARNEVVRERGRVPVGVLLRRPRARLVVRVLRHVAERVGHLRQLAQPVVGVVCRPTERVGLGHHAAGGS